MASACPTISASTTPTRSSCVAMRSRKAWHSHDQRSARASGTKVGLTHEFLDRRDGWRPLSERYRPRRASEGIDHALGYAALRNGSIDVKDAYSTDAKIGENDLVALEDDLHFFPQYKAVFLYRLYAAVRRRWRALNKLARTLDEKRMIRLNAEAERTKNYAAAAATFISSDGQRRSFVPNLPHKLSRWTARHLELAGILASSCPSLSALPLGIVASRGGAVGHSYSRPHRSDPNDSIARAARPARAVAVFRHQRAHRDRRAFSLRAAADRSQHRHRIAGHRTVIRDSAIALGLNQRCASATNLSAARLAHDPRRNQNQRGHQHRHRHAGSADRRRRIGRTDYQRTEPERSCHDSGRRNPGRVPGVAGAMLFRFARSRFDSKRSAFVIIAASASF